MLKTRHFLHPFRSAASLYSRARAFSTRLLAEREISGMKRGSRDVCWCGGSLAEFPLKSSYGICERCGCFVNRRPPLPDELKRLYSFDFYWHKMQKLHGYPLIEERASNDKSDGRVEHWLSVIERLDLPGKRVLEIGCAHGVLLTELAARGYSCVGVEVDETTAEWTRRQTGLQILSGGFPGIQAPDCDLFMCFDVIEHCISPENFLREASKLLHASGVAILQTPIVMNTEWPPFGSMFEKCFDDTQHLFLFSRESIHLLAERVGLSVLMEDSWRLAHEIVVLRKGIPAQT